MMSEQSMESQGAGEEGRRSESVVGSPLADDTNDSRSSSFSGSRSSFKKSTSKTSVAFSDVVVAVQNSRIEGNNSGVGAVLGRGAGPSEYGGNLLQESQFQLDAGSLFFKVRSKVFLHILKRAFGFFFLYFRSLF